MISFPHWHLSSVLFYITCILPVIWAYPNVNQHFSSKSLSECPSVCPVLFRFYEPFQNRKIFWENCGEDDIKFPKERNGRMDPLLKLYKGCQIMLVFNNNVRRGEANGTTVTLISVCLKPNIIPIQILISKLTVKAVYASQVISIVLKHNNPKLLPNTFKLKPIEFCITARILKPQLPWMKEDDRKMVKMKATNTITCHL